MKPVSAQENEIGENKIMKTFLAKVGEIERKTIVIDAADVPVGRLAVKITNALRGKDRPTYTPHVDTGCFVIVINAAKAKLTGNKEEKKIYNDVEKKVKKATKAKSSAKTDLSQEKPTSLLTSLKLLARSFERRHEVSSARIREELERQMRESESSAEHSDDEAENS